MANLRSVPFSPGPVPSPGPSGENDPYIRLVGAPRLRTGTVAPSGKLTEYLVRPGCFPNACY